MVVGIAGARGGTIVGGGGSSAMAVVPLASLQLPPRLRVVRDFDRNDLVGW
jgi:hypothetical protein